MPRSKKLIILLVALLVCISGYFLVSRFLSDDASSEIVDFTLSDVENIKWTYDGTDTQIALDDDKWYYTADEDFPLSQTSAESLADTVSAVTAVKKIADTVDDEAKYGFDSPLLTVCATVADGTEHTFTIGSYNDSTGYYYMMYSGDTALYYTDSSLYSSFSVDIMTLVDFEYLPVTSTSDVTSLSVTSGAKTVSITYYPDGKDGYSDDYTYFFSESGDVCDTDTVTEMISGFINISYLSCEAYNVTASDLSAYGLDSPTAEFTLNYTYTIEAEDETGEDEILNGTDTLLIGKTADSDGETAYYAMIKGGNCVYTVSEDTAKLYMISNEASLYSKQILDFLATELSSLTVTADGKTYTVTAEEDLETDSETSYSMNGADIALDTFVSYLESFIADSVQSEEITGAGDIILSVTLSFTDSTSRTVDIYEYDADLCAVSLDGKLKYFVSENDCDDIYDEFRTAVKTAEDTTQ